MGCQDAATASATPGSRRCTTARPTFEHSSHNPFFAGTMVACSQGLIPARDQMLMAAADWFHMTSVALMAVALRKYEVVHLQ